MAVTLTLGGVVFADFEIPESINFGGAQATVVRKLPGGARQINAMGPDDADIRWSGRFRGSKAEERAILLDYMRRQGQQILLSYGLHLYQVVIGEFSANYQNAGLEIPYSISCIVVQDLTQAAADAAIGFVEAMAADVVNAVGLSGIIPNPAINSAVTGVATAFSNYQAGASGAASAVAGGANAALSFF